jgi:L-malate glycosyltransferase
MKVIQLVHTLTVGDAISGEALAIDRILKEQGIDSQIVGMNVHEKLADRMLKLVDFDRKQVSPDTLFFLHYSIDSPVNELFIQMKGSKRCLLYHNLTPIKWYQSYHARVTNDLIRAKEGLLKVLEEADFILGDSTYNLEELKPYLENSKKETAVLPLFIDPTRWNVEANIGIKGVLRGHQGVNILHVGRTAPNKSLEDIIKSFYFYFHKLNRESKLWLIGSDTDTETYSFELRELIRILQLEESVKLCGAVSDSELKSFYEEADLYLCMSEHEGFCVPLIEAMWFGVPIIAYGACAIPETVAGGGIIIKEKNPAQIAKLMELILTDGEKLEALKEAGKERVETFSEKAFSERFKKLVIERLHVVK